MKFTEYDMLIWEGSKTLKNKIKHIKPILQKARDENEKFSLSFSGGKDSTASLLLALQAGIRPEIVWFNSGYEYPETETYINAIVKKYSLPLRIIRPDIDPLKAKIDAGFFDLIAITKANKDILHNWHSTNKEYDCTITGLRMEENNSRRMALAKNGLYFYNKTFQSNALYPVGRLTAEEIFALLAGLGEDYHPIYDKAEDLKERYWVRVNWYILSAAQHGYYVFLRKHYPEQYYSLAKAMPQIRCYV
jgi:3'-phosphoadenosine 5'-phosphosulfate sulfotransferase (PAPS reductase)/FAD synthetase